jgi:hypothetical protein
MTSTGEFVLWAVIPETDKHSFNRAYGPFPTRSAVYSARLALINSKRKSMRAEGYSVKEIDDLVANIQWSSTGLWSKV